MSAAPTRYDVFLSHNSADYLAAAALEQRLARAGVRPWRAASQLIPGRPWQEEMEWALAQSDTVAVIVGPQGMGPWHNEQMRVAIDDAVQHGKGVIPVLLPGADPERINPFLKRRTWVDFRAGLDSETAFQLMLAGIRGEAPFEAGDLFGLAWARRKDFYRQIPYPTNFVPRPELLVEVRQALLADTAALALTSAIKMDALHGMGGIGKSVMARALCDDPAVQAAFPDGILWTTLGQTPELIPRLREWIDTLGGTVSEIAPTVDRLKAILADLLRDRACLLIVDDAWRKAHAEAFRVGGPRCRLLLTTRDAALADDLGAVVHPVPVMTEPEAVELLEEWAKAGLQGAAPELKGKIVRRLGQLPLAIKLAGAQLQRQEADQWLASFNARKLKARRIEDVHDSLAATFGLSLDELAPTDRRLYVALVIFKEDEPLAVVGIARLWSALDGRDGDETRELLDDLVARALVERSQGDADAIRIHDLLRDFMAAELGDDSRIAAHCALLDAYRGTQEGNGWHTAPDDGYLYDHLVYHLDQLAGEENDAEAELHGLFADPSWLRVRVAQSGYLYDGYLADLDAAWQRAHEATQRRIDADEEPAGLADCVRYALIHTSINSLAGNYDPSLVARAVETGVWSVERAFGIARLVADAERRAAIYTSLLKSHGLSGEQRLAAEMEGLAAAQAISDEWYRARTLAALAPQLSNELLGEGLTMAQAISEDSFRAEALAALAPQLSAEAREATFRKELSAAQAIRDEWSRAEVLAALAPQLSGELLREGLAAAQAISDEWYRARALEALAPHLSGELLRQGLVAAQAMSDEWSRVRALSAVNRQPVGEARDAIPREGMAAAQTCRFELSRAVALAGLVSQLSGKDREAALREGLAAAQAISDEWYRAEVMAALAPLLFAEVLREGLATAQAISDEWYRARALAALAPQLSDEDREAALREGLEAAQVVSDEWSRAGVMAVLAPQLSGEAQEAILREGLTAALAIGEDKEWQRADVLAALAPLLSGEAQEAALREGLAAAKAIRYEWSCAVALAALAPQLSGELLREGLAAVQSISSDAVRAVVLAALAPQLSGKAQVATMQQGLAAARAIGDEWHRARILTALAPWLSGELLEVGLATAQAISDEWHRARTLAALAPQLSNELLGEGLAVAQAIIDVEARAHALAALVPFLEDPSACLPVIRHGMADVLRNSLTNEKREDVLQFCADREILRPPILAPTTLAAIARHIVEICREWE